MTLEDTTILSVKMPNKLELNNDSYFKKTFIEFDYHYNEKESRWRNLGIEMYNLSDFKNTPTQGKKTILGNKKLAYIYYTRHFLDSTKSIQQQFKPYIEKMLAQNKDTLHIGTVSEFKQRHKVLFEKLTKNDSISIQFLDGKKLGERITVPVAW